jgi:DNA-binding SARP family transcriptional activator/tetratricopeptide (TPR) repeat protein
MVEIRVLGRVEVLVGGHPVGLGGRKQRAVLGVLALRAGATVPVEELAGAVWGEDVEVADVLPALQVYLSRLRSVLDTSRGPGGSRVRWDGTGYRLQVPPEQLDLLRFTTQVAAGRASAAAGEYATAADRLRAAEQLWRGPPCPELADAVRVQPDLASLHELHLSAVEDRIDVELALGRHVELVSEVLALARATPLRERPRAQLMLALYRAGRQQEALAEYADLRSTLAETLGVDPTAAVQDLHHAILRQDRALDAPDARSRPSRTGRLGGETTLVPHQLPAGVAHFTGRDHELAILTRLLDQRADEVTQTAPVVISAIAGTAGVGKTALAIHWAHRVADRFPDGQLYVNLRGFDPSAPMLDPAEAVRGFLDTLGAPPEAIPANPDAQAGLYRSLLAGRRMLIVLDNAHDPTQVRPLLPGTPGSLVLVTSRNDLAGLVAAQDATPITLDLLAEADAHQLLAHRLGADRVAAEPDAVKAITAACARLPLALAIVAARAAAHPNFALTALAGELADSHARLDALAGADPTTDVRAVFSWSYQRLSPDAARLFRLLSLHPGPDISTPAAASLAGRPPSKAHTLLTELTGAHLLVEHTPSRYTLHDLLRAYATEQAHTHDTPTDRHSAIHRTLDHYLHTAHTAARLLFARDDITLAPVLPGVTPEELRDGSEAFAWFRLEHSVLAAAVDLAAVNGFDHHTWQLPWTFGDYLDHRGHWNEWAARNGTALRATRRLNDPAAEALVRSDLARAYRYLGRLDAAHAELREALSIYQGLGDPVGEANVNLYLSWLSEDPSEVASAMSLAERALRLFRAVGHRNGEAKALSSLGWYRAQLGDYEGALSACGEALHLHRNIGDRRGEALTLDSIGYAYHHLGDHARAIATYEQALDLERALHRRHGEAETLAHLGDAYHATDQVEPALEAWRSALAIFEELNEPDAHDLRTRVRNMVSSSTSDSKTPTLGDEWGAPTEA